MIQCEICKVWYHYKCLKLEQLPVKNERDILFVRGIGNCSFESYQRQVVYKLMKHMTVCNIVTQKAFSGIKKFDNV